MRSVRVIDAPNASRRLLRAVAGLLLALVMLAGGAARAQFDTTFNHDTSRFPLTGRHRLAQCESCHLGDQFVGTPRRCDVCHSGTSGRAETRPSSNHIPIRATCDTCHTTNRWEPARMDHGSTGDRCVSCHTGNMATAKPRDHIQSSNNCGECHGTIRWGGARFNHDGIVAPCVSCHNGQTATGKPLDHIPASNECQQCHSTSRWSPATRFDHTGITTGCITCHNGQQAPGKGPNHPMPSGNDCEVCHTTRAWTPAGFDHTGVSPGTCSTCHNGSQATGRPSDMIHTTTAGMSSCDTCHTTRAWTPATFNHTGVSPGTCNTCHNGAQASGRPNDIIHNTTTYIPSCDSCHLFNATRPTWSGARVHRAVVTPGTCNTCHDGRTATGKPNDHPRTTASCDQCHSTTSWNTGN